MRTRNKNAGYWHHRRGHAPKDQEALRQGIQLKKKEATVLRSALYHYIKQNGIWPDELRSLVRDYPNHYLSVLPKAAWQYTPRKDRETDVPHAVGLWVCEDGTVRTVGNRDCR